MEVNINFFVFPSILKVLEPLQVSAVHQCHIGIRLVECRLDFGRVFKGEDVVIDELGSRVDLVCTYPYMDVITAWLSQVLDTSIDSHSNNIHQSGYVTLMCYDFTLQSDFGDYDATLCVMFVSNLCLQGIARFMNLLNKCLRVCNIEHLRICDTLFRLPLKHCVSGVRHLECHEKLTTCRVL